MSTITEVEQGLVERINPEEIPGIFQEITINADVVKTDKTQLSYHTQSFQPLLDEPETDGYDFMRGSIAGSRMFNDNRRVRLVLEDPMPPMSSVNGQFPVYEERNGTSVIDFELPTLGEDSEQDDYPYTLQSDIVLALPHEKYTIPTDVTCFYSQLTPSERAAREEAQQGSWIKAVETYYVSREKLEVLSDMPVLKPLLDDIDGLALEGLASGALVIADGHRSNDYGIEQENGRFQISDDITLTRVDEDGLRQVHTTRATYTPYQDSVTRPDASDDFHHVTCATSGPDTISRLTMLVPQRVSLDATLAEGARERRRRLEEDVAGGSCAADLRGAW
ncbi:hypothetical protein L198_01100 [Cryptococcus wingfieldii CBS 7118]|uniref:Uncharacterized protein n=1 Tax=Cryptococcus wingfieldii CBS 7118 TaxID=1295528 RepID=A0A1E3K3B2_9TREE|nr:hypothetical protein L198_01100 [Cryptococcus wingfieldii CBS 7118]ODO07521.1 hypothetical protein L198_01100 [Cryptococcus wingfieldii CBS 7118]